MGSSPFCAYSACRSPASPVEFLLCVARLARSWKYRHDGGRPCPVWWGDRLYIHSHSYVIRTVGEAWGGGKTGTLVNQGGAKGILGRTAAWRAGLGPTPGWGVQRLPEGSYHRSVREASVMGLAGDGETQPGLLLCGLHEGTTGGGAWGLRQGPRPLSLWMPALGPVLTVCSEAVGSGPHALL